MKSGLFPYLLLGAMVFHHASSFRDAHSEGLQEDHKFSKASWWPVTGNDELILGKILNILNPQGADVKWKWQKEFSHWTFGLVKLTAQDARGALALHMLHRHGLAPLLASRAGTRFLTGFQSKLQSNGNPAGDERAKLLVEAQEEYNEVQTLRALLNELTLSGLRNLHSYDHQWSVDIGEGKVQGCTQKTPGPCVLQAGYSQVAHSFLRQNGFTPAVSSSVQSSAFKIMVYIFNPLGYWHLGRTNRNALTTTQNTGDIAITNWTRKGSSNWLKALFIGKKKVAVDVKWEGGAGTTLNILIDDEMNAKLKSAVSNTEKTAALEELVNAHITNQVEGHKQYMLENRLTIWAGEEGEFVELFPGEIA